MPNERRTTNARSTLLFNCLQSAKNAAECNLNSTWWKTSDDRSQNASPKPQVTTVPLDRFWSLAASSVRMLQCRLAIRRTMKEVGKNTRAKPAVSFCTFTCALRRNAAVRRRGIIYHRCGLPWLLFILQLKRPHTREVNCMPPGVWKHPSSLNGTSSLFWNKPALWHGAFESCWLPSKALPLEISSVASQH